MEERWDGQLIAAIEAGLSIESFWNLTPRQYALHLRARDARAAAQMRRALAAAWHIAALVRMDKLPRLEEILDPPQREESEQELARLAQEHEGILAAMTAARDK